MFNRLYFNPTSDFSLSSPAVQHDTVIVCLQRLVLFPRSAKTGVFVATRACFERGQNVEIKSTRRWRGAQEDVDALCGNTVEFLNTHFLKPSKTSNGKKILIFPGRLPDKV